MIAARQSRVETRTASPVAAMLACATAEELLPDGQDVFWAPQMALMVRWLAKVFPMLPKLYESVPTCRQPPSRSMPQKSA